ncbi:protein of unknown function [Candidatus Filomicrobium marinum]|uniref:Uncharacterized protein n=1 Tax=Candidatus Filomicrobium marinum TaxID=1608628 RepID=A0A0D6JE97_9HYPH|nr:protein of unknown function [Candidatus Filomicrobium marinum]CPR18598.1 protein of unknown function [Candidatus Filomicrobium marinum]
MSSTNSASSSSSGRVPTLISGAHLWGTQLGTTYHAVLPEPKSQKHQGEVNCTRLTCNDLFSSSGRRARSTLLAMRA